MKARDSTSLISCGFRLIPVGGNSFSTNVLDSEKERNQGTLPNYRDLLAHNVIMLALGETSII